MNRFFLSAFLILASASIQAQETYESAELATQDLNGTARYIGMGGAMEALGADISTMTTNPAGIGLFRKSWIGASAGLTIQRGNNYSNSVYSDNGKTNADFNQIGAIFSMQTGGKSYVNFGFNFQKNRNFNQILNAMGALTNSSASEKMVLAMNSDTEQYTNTDDMIYDNYNDQGVKHMPYGTQYYGMNDNKGYIGEFDFNFSGNIKNRVFLGLSIGINNVNYEGCANYYEDLAYKITRSLNYEPTTNTQDQYDLLTANYPIGLETINRKKISGSGVNVKFGVIWRPIETSPFRIGAYIHTPTWYRLTYDVWQDVYTDFTSSNKSYAVQQSVGGRYHFSTPWKFGFSLGHTIGNMVALGATYEFADYSTINNTYVEDYYSGYDDKIVNNNTKESLKGAHTIKIGAEVKPVPEVAIRMGYNLQTGIYDKNKGYKDYIEHDHNGYYCGAFYTSNDYTNWGATNRITFGLGFALDKHISLDLSYQYATQKGEYHTFATTSGTMYQNGDADNIPTGETLENGTVMQEVKNDRHQINCTLSYKF